MAGDFDYETHGSGYSTQRRADPRIESQLHVHLGDAASVLNVGAGAGSYEPSDRYVVAIEPSASMRSQRRVGRPAINGIAESLPFDDDAFDLVMATITVHQWNDPLKGLSELRRVSRGKVLVLTFDSEVLLEFWLNHYSPEVIAAERRRYPDISVIGKAIGSSYDVVPVTVPQDCTDGFGEAFYGRPERFLDPAVRKAQSGWGFVDGPDEQRFVEHLTSDLASGEWDRRWGQLRTQAEYDASLRLLVGHP
jgi:SAM-dependent methyltransferase